MSPAAVIETIHKLMPLIQNSGSAEETLLKFARDKNLAPEQLTKLATTLNTARNLSWMENNPQARGTSIPIIDTVKLAAEYSSYRPAAPAVKKASFDLADETPVPNFFKLASAHQDIHIKVASIADEPDFAETPGDLFWADYMKRATVHRNIDRLDDIRDDHREAYIKEVKKVAKHLLVAADHQIMREMEEDVRTLGTHEDYTAFKAAAYEAAEYSAFNRKSTRELFSNPSNQIKTARFLAVDRHNILARVKSASAELVSMSCCVELMKQMPKEAGYTDDDISDIGKTKTPFGDAEDLGPDGIDDMMGQRDTGRRQMGDDPSGTSRGDTAGDRRDNGGSRGSGEFPRRETRRSNAESGGGGNRGGGGLSYLKGGPGGGDPAKDVADSITQMLIGKQEAGGGLLVGKGNTLKALDYITGGKASESLDLKKLAPGYVKGVRQKGIDDGVRDVKAVSTIQRLIITDPILSEADPEIVVGFYNDLVSGDPTLAQNPNRLRFALREALSYGGVPSQTFKTLTEVNKNDATATKSRQDMMKELYA